MWRTPQASEAGARVETLYTKDGDPARPGERAYRKQPDGRMVLQSVTIGQQVKMWPTPRSGKTTDEKEESWQVRKDAGKVSTPPLTLAVKMWPTPSVCGNYNRAGASPTSGDGLATKVKMWPTPTANEDACGKPTGQMQAMLGNHPALGKTSESGSLNPAWVEWLMGYPIGHTVCAGWVTRLSRKLPKKSCEQSAPLKEAQSE